MHTVRKIITATGMALALAAGLTLAGCGTTPAETQDARPQDTEAAVTQAEGDAGDTTVTVTALDAAGDPVQITVPKNPERVAVLDMAALDIIDALGCGGSVVGSATTNLDYLQSYMENDSVVPLGTVKEADLEAIAACQPDIIFIGGRLAASYDALSEIAPVVYLAIDAEQGVYQSTRSNAESIASIFGAEDKVEGLFSGFDERIDKLAATADGTTAIIGLATSGSFNILGNEGRLSLIVNELGFENVGADSATPVQRGEGGGQQGGTESNPHGNESSFETIVSLDPDYIFVLDRDSAIGSEGAQLAQDIMDNELVNGTRAAQAGNVRILAHPAAWYIAEGGITALDLMLSDMEAALGF